MVDKTAGPLPANRYKFPSDSYEQCYRIYAQTNSRVAAARGCGVSLSTISRRLVQDPIFKEGMMEAKALYIHGLEAEAHRRAITGVTQTKPGPGGAMYPVTTYSDALLIHMLKKADPKKHGDKLVVDHQEAPEMPIGLESLTEENQDRLRIILESSVEVDPKQLGSG